MALITWSDEYTVNVREIDEQHQKWIGLINKLFDAMSRGKGSLVLGKVLAEMVDYTIYHFETEERLFRLHGYPGGAAHKKAHDALADRAMALKESFDSGNTLISIEVMHFLRDWLNAHILEEDRKYGPYLNHMGVQ